VVVVVVVVAASDWQIRIREPLFGISSRVCNNRSANGTVVDGGCYLRPSLGARVVA